MQTFGNIGRKLMAWAILAVVAVVFLKLAIGLVMGVVYAVATVALIIALVFAVMWALRVSRS